MTKEEFIEKYGNVEVKFSSYYKYVFTYEAILPDSKVISVGYGGGGEDIYRHEVESGKKVTIGLLCPHMGSVCENGKDIESFYEYY